MTVSTNDMRDEYTAIAAQTAFAYTFKIYDEGDLNVYLTPNGQDADDTSDLLTLTTDYTVANVGQDAGGSITLTSGASAGDLVTIVADISKDRDVDYQDNGDFRPDTVNDDIDKTVSLAKQNAERLDRALLGQESEQSFGGPFTFEAPEAGKFLRWKTDLSGVENSEGTTSVTSVDSETASGTWTITGVDSQKLLFILLDGSASATSTVVRLRATSGTLDGRTSDSSSLYKLGSSTSGSAQVGNCFVVSPTATTVEIAISTITAGCVLRAYQQ